MPFYRDVLELEPGEAYGDQWVEFSAGGVTVALDGSQEMPVAVGNAGLRPAVALACDNLETVLETVRESGARVVVETCRAGLVPLRPSWQIPKGIQSSSTSATTVPSASPVHRKLKSPRVLRSRFEWQRTRIRQRQSIDSEPHNGSGSSRGIAVALIVLAVAVGLNLMLTPVYHDGGETYPIWQVMNWFMAVAVVIALLISFHRVRSLNGGPNDPVTREYLGATALFLGATGLIVIFYWNWLWTLLPESETGMGRPVPTSTTSPGWTCCLPGSPAAPASTSGVPSAKNDPRLATEHVRIVPRT